MSVAPTRVADRAVDALTDAVTFYERLNPNLVDIALAREAEREVQEELAKGRLRTDEEMTLSLQRAAIRLLIVPPEPIGVSGDACELLDVAARSFRAEPLDPTDLLMPYGFAHFDVSQELPHQDGGAAVLCTDLVWGMTSDREGILVAMLGPSRFREGNGDHTIRIRQCWCIRWGDTKYEGMPAFPRLQAFWRLMQQRILSKRLEAVGRAARRRADREITRALVVSLRRTKPRDTDEGEEAVHWTHRWLVGGHWRAQWIPSRQRHEQRWIAPYIKGPPDKPLIAKSRRFQFVR